VSDGFSSRGPVGLTSHHTVPFTNYHSAQSLNVSDSLNKWKATAPMDSERSVKVLRGIGELEEIREVWESWPGNRDSEMESYMRHAQSNRVTERPHVIVVEREGKPEAILVGRLDLGRINCRLGYLHLDLPARILCFVYGAFRGNASRENSRLIVKSVMDSLKAREADVAYMNYLRDDSELLRLSIEKPRLLCRDYVRTQQLHFATRLPNSAEEFQRGLSSSARWQAKSRQKKLTKDFAGDVKIRCFREVAELESLIRDVEQVAKTSYQRGLGVGFVDSPVTRDGLRLKAERGWLRAYVLYLAERPCAFWIGDINQGTFGSDYIGYDAGLGKYSPGMYLTTKVIEGFCGGNSEGVTAVDFATGHAQYKEVLSNQKWREVSIYIFAPTLKGISFNFARTVIGGMDQAIKKVLERTNLLRRVKKVWRDHAKLKEAARADA